MARKMLNSNNLHFSPTGEILNKDGEVLGEVEATIRENMKLDNKHTLLRGACLPKHAPVKEEQRAQWVEEQNKPVTITREDGSTVVTCFEPVKGARVLGRIPVAKLQESIQKAKRAAARK